MELAAKLYYRSRSSDKNPENLLLVFSDNCYYERHFNMIGFSQLRRTFLCSRTLLPNEAIWISQTYRFNYYRYFSWEGLIEDEINNKAPIDWIDTIKDFSLSLEISAISLAQQKKIDSSCSQLTLNF